MAQYFAAQFCWHKTTVPAAVSTLGFLSPAIISNHLIIIKQLVACAKVSKSFNALRAVVAPASVPTQYQCQGQCKQLHIPLEWPAGDVSMLACPMLFAFFHKSNGWSRGLIAWWKRTPDVSA